MGGGRVRREAVRLRHGVGRRAAGKDFDTLDAAGNGDPEGIWSDGTTMWVADDPWFGEKVYAYNLSTMARDAGKDIDVLELAGNDNPEDIWSNGTTMWVADYTDDKLYAYDMDQKDRDPGKDVNALEAAGNIHPQGIWSDGSDDVGRGLRRREALCLRYGFENA